MMRPMRIWPITGNTMVCTLPRRAWRRILPVRKMAPQRPPAQIQRGAPSRAAAGKDHS